MSKPNPNDISIGEDEWITFIEVPGRLDQAVCVDPLIAPLESFWTALETNCVAECCGIDAFSLWPEDIRHAASTVDANLLENSLTSLRELVEKNAADVFDSKRLNFYFERQVLLQLITHIKANSNPQSDPITSVV